MPTPCILRDVLLQVAASPKKASASAAGYNVKIDGTHASRVEQARGGTPADATRAEIEINHDSAQLVILITDDGRGTRLRVTVPAQLDTDG